MLCRRLAPLCRAISLLCLIGLYHGVGSAEGLLSGAQEPPAAPAPTGGELGQPTPPFEGSQHVEAPASAPGPEPTGGLPEQLPEGTQPSAPETPSRAEARGFWVPRWDIQTAASIDVAVTAARLLGMNLLLIQVAGEGEAYYRSDLLPRPLAVAQDFDPLAYAIEKGHAAGIEIHAWINVYASGTLAGRPPNPAHPLNQHPEWVTSDRFSRTLWDPAARRSKAADALPGMMWDPGVPAVRDFTVRVVRELLDRYDVDGIHLDYIRYPSVDYGYHPTSRTRFWAVSGFDPLEFESDPAGFRRKHGKALYDRLHVQWREWRRDEVTTLVRELYDAVRAAKPWVRVSAAVFADESIALNDKLQDWPRWLELGLVDFVVPMAYATRSSTVSRWLSQVVQAAADRQVHAGIGAYLLANNFDEFARQIDAARRAGADGIILFSQKSVTNSLETLQALVQGPFQDRPAMPEMPWKPPRPES